MSSLHKQMYPEQYTHPWVGELVRWGTEKFRIARVLEEGIGWGRSALLFPVGRKGLSRARIGYPLDECVFIGPPKRR